MKSSVDTVKEALRWRKTLRGKISDDELDVVWVTAIHRIKNKWMSSKRLITIMWLDYIEYAIPKVDSCKRLEQPCPVDEDILKRTLVNIEGIESLIEKTEIMKPKPIEIHTISDDDDDDNTSIPSPLPSCRNIVRHEVQDVVMKFDKSGDRLLSESDIQEYMKQFEKLEEAERQEKKRQETERQEMLDHVELTRLKLEYERWKTFELEMSPMFADPEDFVVEDVIYDCDDIDE
jgi:hypothetical protein